VNSIFGITVIVEMDVAENVFECAEFGMVKAGLTGVTIIEGIG
jgi:hypothetical protein